MRVLLQSAEQQGSGGWGNPISFFKFIYLAVPALSCCTWGLVPRPGIRSVPPARGATATRPPGRPPDPPSEAEPARPGEPSATGL